MLNLSYEAKGTLFTVDLVEGVTMIKDDSGTGKSFLFDTMAGELRERGIGFRYLDHKNRESARDILHGLSNECSMVILDNADLYLTNDILKYLKSTVKYIVIAMKGCHGLCVSDVDFCAVDYQAGHLKLVSVL